MKTHKIKLLSFSLLFAFFAGACEPDEPIVEPFPYPDPSIWNSAVSDAEIKSSAIMPAFNNEIAVCFQRFQNTEYFVGLNAATGTIKWKTKVPDADYTTIEEAYTVGNKHVFYDSKIRCLDISTGVFEWNTSDFNLLTKNITGLGNNFYFVAKSGVKPQLGAVYMGNVQTGTATELCTAPFADSIKTDSPANTLIGSIINANPVTYNNKNLLIIQSFFFRNYAYYGDAGFPFIGIFDLDNKIWLWNIPVEKEASGFYTKSAIAEGNFYFAYNTKYASYNLISGAKNWEYAGHNAYGWREMCVAQNTMLFIFSGELTAVSTETGKFKWRLQLGYTNEPTRIMPLNGVAYFVAHGSACAVDIEAGKFYWKLISKDSYNNPNLQGDNAFAHSGTIIPGQNNAKGKVIFSTFFSTYGYEAIK